MTEQGHIPTILDIQDKALLLPARPQFWTSHDMADFYQTTPQRVVEQMRRNPRRFPEDFWFELREDEISALVGHFARPNRALVTQIAGPNAGLSKVTRGTVIGFTKAGALALSGVLKTPVADAVSVQIVRAVIAMEEAAISDARNMVAKLQIEALQKKPIYSYVERSIRHGLSIGQMWRQSNYPRWKLEQAAREMLAMRLTDRLPHGMQPDLFGDR